MEVPRDLFHLETLSLIMLADALMTPLVVLILIYTVSSRDTVRELPAKEPSSYKLFTPSAFYQCFCLEAFLQHIFTSDVYML